MRALVLLLLCAGCTGPDEAGAPVWQKVLSDLPGALLRVWGTGPTDVYAVGADADGAGPMFVHFDGTSWKRLGTGSSGDLWWIDRVGADDLRIVGEGGQILGYRPSTGAFTKKTAPTVDTLFGVWGASSTDVWYVGGQPGGRGVAWRDDGDAIRAAGTSTTSGVFFKVHGLGERVTLVGEAGGILQYDGSRFVDRGLGGTAPLLTVHGTTADALYAVGGFGSGLILRFDGARWIDETPSEAPGLNGVYATSVEEAWAAGFNGRIFHRKGGVWGELEDTLPTYLDLHSIWIDPAGGVWASGGQLVSDPPSDGVLIYYGPPIAHGLE